MDKSLIDQFGFISAQIAELEAKKKAVRDQIVKAGGEGAFEGTFYRVTVSKSVRETLDMAACRAKLSPQFIAAHTKTTEVVVVKAGVRNNINVAESVINAVAA